MKTSTIIIIVAIVLAAAIAGGLIYYYQTKPKQNIESTNVTQPTATATETIITNQGAGMKISSFVFQENQKIPPKYTCDLENVNPPLQISGVPEGAKSLVLVMDDPDASGGTFTHWTLWNIDPSIKEIAENSVPAGAVQGNTSFGKPGYNGPCPPQGQHRYIFHLYALNSKLDLPEGATKADLDKAMTGKVIEEAKYTGVYKLSDN